MKKRETFLNLPIFTLVIPPFVFLFFLFLTFLNLRNAQAPDIFSLITRPYQPKICPQETFYFRKMFKSVLNTLVTNDWQPNGDWKNDMMHDATSFAPYVLYQLGKECRNQNYISMANTTVEYEISLINYVLEELKKPNPNKEEIKRRLYPTIMGHLALIEGSKNYSGQKFSKTKISLYTQASYLTANFVILALSPEQYKNYIPSGFDSVTAFAFIADGDFMLYRQTKNPLYAFLGWAAIEKANSLFWQENNFGKYYGEKNKPPEVFNQGYMLAALAQGYQLTNNLVFLAKKEAIVETLNQKYWDDEFGAYVSISSPEVFSRNISLSHNNAVVYGFLRWQQVKKEPVLDSKIKLIFSFFEKYLFESGRIYHYYDLRTGRRANYFCSGCNFFVLDTLYAFNRPELVKVSQVSKADFENFKKSKLETWLKGYKEGKVPDVLRDLELKLLK